MITHSAVFFDLDRTDAARNRSTSSPTGILPAGTASGYSTSFKSITTIWTRIGWMDVLEKESQ